MNNKSLDRAHQSHVMAVPQHGFILTRQQFDRDGKLTLRYWMRGEQTAFFVDILNERAVCFIPAAAIEQVRSLVADLAGVSVEPLTLKNVDREPVAGLYSQSLKHYWQAVELLREAKVPLYEEDIRAADRYLMERFIQGGAAYDPTTRRLSPSEFVPGFRVLSVDIETTMRADQIHSIAVYSDTHQWVLMRGEGEPSDHVVYLPTEKALLVEFAKLVAELDPDIFIGWSVIDFDFRVLQQRAEALKIPLRLGRDNEPLNMHHAKTGGGRGKQFARMGGRVVLDGIDTLKGATYHFESFALDAVAGKLLDRGKLIDKSQPKGEEIQRMFYEDKVALARYNLEDCRLVWDIFEHAQLLHYLVERTRLTGLTIDKVGGSAAAFDNQYLPLMHRAGYVAPEYASGAGGLDAPGGYVMDSLPGLYRHVLVLDFKSLYPSIIRTFFIDPVGMIEGLTPNTETHSHSPDDLIPGFNHAIFSQQHAILPNLIETLWQARDKAKAANNKPLSQAIKIIMNSFYGVLGSNVCRFFDQRLSSSITLRGHEILLKTQEVIEQQFGYTVIYGDTDSVFIWLGDDFDAKQTHAEGRKLETELNRWWQDQLKERFNVPCHLELEFETYYSQFLMPRVRGADKGSKKRYAGLLSDENGQQEMVFKGLESVRSDWTPVAREIQTELYRRVFMGEAWQSWLQNWVKEVLAGEHDQKLIYRKRLRQPLAQYQKNRPPQVQAAQKAHDYYLAQGLPSPYRAGSYIEYIITVNGPEEAALRQSPIDYQHYVDKQIMPVADTLLQFLDVSFEALVAPQLSLFS
ncbi:MAG: DNA polymerase II [Pontibacterium sp.]